VARSTYRLGLITSLAEARATAGSPRPGPFTRMRAADRLDAPPGTARLGQPRRVEAPRLHSGHQPVSRLVPCALPASLVPPIPPGGPGPAPASGGKRRRWPIDVALTATMGHPCRFGQVPGRAGTGLEVPTVSEGTARRRRRGRDGGAPEGTARRRRGRRGAGGEGGTAERRRGRRNAGGRSPGATSRDLDHLQPGPITSRPVTGSDLRLSRSAGDLERPLLTGVRGAGRFARRLRSCAG
jgi:hypothetical protein